MYGFKFGGEVIAILRKPFYEDWEKHQEKIIEAIFLRNQAERLARQAPLARKLVAIQDGRQSYLVNPADVVMVKTGAKGQGKTDVLFQHHRISCNLSLSQILAKLPTDFVQVNRFEAINLAWVSLIDHANKEVRLRNGGACLIGTNFYPTLCGLME